MKAINFSNCSLHNELKASMSMPEPSIGIDSLIRKFYDCNSFYLTLFYYRLEVCGLY